MKRWPVVHLPKELRRLTDLIGRKAAEKGLKVYCVGGFVRDFLLKRRNLDLDVVVEGDAGTLARELALELNAEATMYTQFGTATLQLGQGGRLDLASARQERYLQPGALPVVRPGGIEDDLFRRDFTINAMALRIGAGGFEEIVDPYGGRKDLKEKKIRVLHPKSFTDDPTRILRAVRFEQRFGFRIESVTLRQLKTTLKRAGVATVKPARYFAEFRKILREQKPVPVLRRLHRLGGLAFLRKNFRPDWRLLTRIEQSIGRLSRQEIYSKQDWTPVYLAGLFGSVGKVESEKLGGQFNLSRTERNVLAQSGSAPGLIRTLKKKKPASGVYERLESLPVEIICFIRTQTSDKIIAQSVDDFLKRSRHVRAELTGDDLQKLGISPGKRVGEILRMLLLKRIDRAIGSREEEIQTVKSILSQSQ